MARVVLVPRKVGTVAVSLAYLRQRKTMTIDGIELSWTDGVASALDKDRIADSRDTGSVSAVDPAPRRAIMHHMTFAFVAYAFHPDVPIMTETGLLILKPRT